MAGLDDLSLEQLQAMRAAKTGTVAPVDAVHQIESGAAPDTSRVVNPASGAQGSMQVMPTTQVDPGFGVKPSNGTPEDTARAGRDYYAAMQAKYKDPVMAAVAYNWGPGNADKWAAGGSKLDELPLETLKYIKQFKQKVEPAALPQEALQQAGAPQQDVAPPGPAASLQPSILGRIGTGIGDFVGGAARGIVSGMGALGVPGADEAVKQIDAQKVANDAAFKAKQQAAGQDTTGTDWVRVGGQMIPAFLIPGGAATGVGRLAAGAYGGALGNVAMTQPGESYAKNAATGAGIGLAGAGLAAGIGKVLKGVNVSPNAKALIDQGVTPTPGQLMGGMAKTVEERATSIPLVGDLVKSAQQGAVKDMNLALYKQVLDPVGEAAPKTFGRDAIAEVGDKLSERYQKLLPNMTFQVDNGFVNDMSAVSAKVAALPEPQQRSFASIMDRNFFSQLKQGKLTGEEMKDVESALTKEAGDFAIGDPYHRKLADTIRDTQGAIRGALMRANPAQADELKAINTAYSRYAILRDAGSRVNNPDNPISAGQLQAAVKKANKTVGKGGFAKGEARLQGLSDPAMSVLGSSYPDSGTAGRMMLGSGMLGGIGALAGPGTAAAGLGVGALYGTDIGRRTMLAALARRPEFARLLGNGIQSSAPQVGAALGAAYGANK